MSLFFNMLSRSLSSNSSQATEMLWGGQVCLSALSRRRELTVCPVESDSCGFIWSCLWLLGTPGNFLSSSQPDFPHLGHGAIKENSLSVLLTVGRPLPGTWEQSKFSSLINNDTPLLAMKSRYHLRLISFCFLILWNCTYFFSFSYHCFLLSCYHVTCVRVQNDDQSKQRGGNIKGRV